MKIEHQTMEEKQKSFPFLTILIFIFILFFVVSFLYFFVSNNRNKNATNITENLEIYINNQENPVVRSKMNAHANEKVVASGIIDTDFPAPFLRISTDQQRLEVYSDDELIYMSAASIKDSDLGFDIHTILLKERKSQHIKIIFQSPFDLYAEMIGDVWLGDIDSLDRKLIANETPFIIMLVHATFIGIVFMVVSLKQIRKSAVARANFYFGAFSILWGMLTVLRQGFMRFFFPPNTLYVFFVLTNMVFLIPLFAYIYYISNHTKVPVLIAALIQSVTSITFTALHFAGVMHFADGIDFYNKLLVISLVIIFVSIFIEIIRGNRYIRFLCPGILLVALILALDSYYLFAGTLWKNINLSNYVIYILMLFIWIYQVKLMFNNWTKQVKINQSLNANNRLSIKNQERMISCFEHTKTISHEVKHHLAALKILVDGGKIERVKKYINALDTTIDTSFGIVLSGHYLVDAIVSNYIDSCFKHNIKVTYELNVSKELSIEDIDLTSLLLNMLDNALEACLKIESEQRFIEIIILQKEQMLLISIKNSFNGVVTQKEKRFITSKSDKSHHGNGIAIMESVCEKNNSMLQIIYDEKSFIVKTLLPL